MIPYSFLFVKHFFQLLSVFITALGDSFAIITYVPVFVKRFSETFLSFFQLFSRIQYLVFVIKSKPQMLLLCCRSIANIFAHKIYISRSNG